MARKVLIYGGSGGIGSATARALHHRGYALHLVGRTEEKLAAVAQETGATFTQGDVNDRSLFVRASKEAGDVLDRLVYAIGSLNLNSLQRLTESDFLSDYRLNALGAVLAVQAALPVLMKSQDTASIVLFSTIAVRQGFAFHASIGMAKGAVEGLTLSSAAELAPKVRVNAIAPSPTRTSLAGNVIANEKMSESNAGLHAQQRRGEPNDIAALAAFLVSSDASWITGQIIGVYGGRSSIRSKG